MKKNRDPRLDNDPEFIAAPKYKNKLSRLLEHNPYGVSDQVICKVLKLTPEEVEAIYSRAIIKLRQAMKVSEDE